MSERRVGLWLIGACGGVGATTALGLAALRRDLIPETGLVSALPALASLDLDAPRQMVIGGHDIRSACFEETIRELQARSQLIDPALIEACLPELSAWSANIRPGTLLDADDATARFADFAHPSETASAAIERLQQDLLGFRETNHLDQVVVVNVASTEPPWTLTPIHHSRTLLAEAIRREHRAGVLPPSGLYAWATLDLGIPYINFTPSLGASFDAALELAEARATVLAGRDAKTGETLLKTALAPLFAQRHLEVLSWVGHNILGNRDGLVLDHEANKQSKLQSKQQATGAILGYQPQTRVSIEYVSSLDDWKVAWDFVHFRGFLGAKMSLQLIWQGADSLLAAPLVIDLARLTLHSQRRGERGVLRHLACFFKDPMGVAEHDFFKQCALLEQYARSVRAAAEGTPPLAAEAGQAVSREPPRQVCGDS